MHPEAGRAAVARRAVRPQRPGAAGAATAPRRLGLLLLCLLLACLCAVAPRAVADDASTAVDANSGYIVDSQNLLGDDLSKVSDAITRTREETGVNVRLLYIPTFNSDNPEQWATATLKSLEPPANTVLLAVASNDGNLAVVVSPDSDEWLRSKQTVDQLSEAASAPLVTTGSEGPNWSKSAIDMMDAIVTAKRTSTSSSVASMGIVAMVAIAVLLVAVTAGFIIVRRRREAAADAKEEVGQEEKAAADATAPSDGHDGTPAAEAAPDTGAATKPAAPAKRGKGRHAGRHAAK
ncbi:MAG: TPM domain-containing protein [Bifidobacterium sp.]|nr:TPM domain-containing protein [Bifidobacterium sp.]